MWEPGLKVLDRGIGMGTSTKLPGERFLFPELALSSANGVSSIPRGGRVEHRKRERYKGVSFP